MRLILCGLAALAVVALSASNQTSSPVSEAAGSTQAQSCDPEARGCHVVNSTNGETDPHWSRDTCNDTGGECTLNDAIWAASADGQVTSYIHFDIPGCGSDRVCTISPQDQPYAGVGLFGDNTKNDIIIDGATQGCDQWPCIRLDGGKQTDSERQWGLKIFSSGVEIRNMGFFNFIDNRPVSKSEKKEGHGVIVYGKESGDQRAIPGMVQRDNVIENNLFEGNDFGIRAGIEYSGGTMRDTRIAYNTIRNSQRGIYMNAAYRGSSTITGFTVTKNVIYNASISGIQLVILDAGKINNNLINGNRVENSNKGAYAGSRGIVLSASKACPCKEPGATSVAENNKISGNIVKRFNDDGIVLVTTGPDSYVRDNTIGSNRVSGNGRNGIHLYRFKSNIAGSDGNVLTRNSVHSNSWLGINLGANGGSGGLVGPGGSAGCSSGSSGTGEVEVNNNVPCPKVTKTAASNGQCQVSGTFSGGNVKIELFQARPGPGDDPGQSPGVHGETKKFLVGVNDANGGSWSVVIPKQPRGARLTATATTGAGTSEFSMNLTVSRNCRAP